MCVCVCVCVRVHVCVGMYIFSVLGTVSAFVCIFSELCQILYGDPPTLENISLTQNICPSCLVVW